MIGSSCPPWGAIWWKWSITERAVKPPASAVVAMSARRGKSSAGGTSGYVNEGTWRPMYAMPATVPDNATVGGTTAPRLAAARLPAAPGVYRYRAGRGSELYA